MGGGDVPYFWSKSGGDVPYIGGGDVPWITFYPQPPACGMGAFGRTVKTYP